MTILPSRLAEQNQVHSFPIQILKYEERNVRFNPLAFVCLFVCVCFLLFIFVCLGEVFFFLGGGGGEGSDMLACLLIACLFVKKKERRKGSEGKRERERERERQTDRDRDRQTDREGGGGCDQSK